MHTRLTTGMFLASMALCVGTAAAQTIRTQRAIATVATDPSTGLTGLASIGDVTEPAAFTFDFSRPLWSVELSDPFGGGPPVTLDPTRLSCTSGVRVLSPTRLAIDWLGCSAGALTPGQTFDVTVEAAFDPRDDALLLDIAVTTRTPSHALRVVEFPRLDIGPRGSTIDEVMTWPWVSGWMFPSPRINPILCVVLANTPLPMPGQLSMQWWSYYDRSEQEPAVLFFGTRDRTGHYREVVLGDPGTHLPFRLRHIPADVRRDNDYRSPYPFALRTLRGDWYDAARYYRAWALTQPWTQQGPMHANPRFSKLIRNARMFAANSTFLHDNTRDPINFRYLPRDVCDMARHFEIGTLPQHNYLWHTGTALGNGGEWFPIEPEYAASGFALRALGHPHAPYFYPLVYNSTLPSYRQSYVPGHLGRPIEPFGIMAENGARTFIRLNNNPALCLCPTPSFMTDYTQFVADGTRTGAGCQGIYLDVFTAESAKTCYDPSHGHPVGGGDHYMQGKLRLLDQLRQRQRLSEPEYFVFSEGQSELYLGRVEMTYSHTTHVARLTPDVFSIAPLFETVYSDYQVTTTVGPALLQRDPETLLELDTFFRRFIAVHTFMGHTPWTGSLLEPPPMDAVVPNHAFLQRSWTLVRNSMAILRADVVDEFFTLGERLREPTVDVGRVIPGPEDREYLLYTLDQPMVYVSAWRSPRRAGAGFLLQNWTASTDRFPGNGRGGDATATVCIDMDDLGLAAGQFRIVETTPRGDVLLAQRFLRTGDTLVLPVRAAATRFVRLDPTTD